jgi:hypothetical protein
MVEKPIVPSLVWTFVSNSLFKSLQNLTVILAIDGLTRGYKFLVDNSLDVEKSDQHGLDIGAKLTHFVGHSEFGNFHCDDCCLVSRS